MGRLLTPAEDHSRRVLGAAVHPGAIRRLHELFPDAFVKVRHETNKIELPHGSRKMSNMYYAQPEHETYVYIDLDGDRRSGGTIWAKAVCHPLDNFDRRKGIELAFRRALDIARKNHQQREWTRAQHANAARRAGRLIARGVRP